MIGLDVHKATISVAVAHGERDGEVGDGDGLFPTKHQKLAVLCVAEPSLATSRFNRLIVDNRLSASGGGAEMVVRPQRLFVAMEQLLSRHRADDVVLPEPRPGLHGDLRSRLDLTRFRPQPVKMGMDGSCAHPYLDALL